MKKKYSIIEDNRTLHEVLILLAEHPEISENVLEYIKTLLSIKPTKTRHLPYVGD